MDSKEWLGIINAHIQWKQRLEAYINDSSDETFDVVTVASDKKCILGQWIYSVGQAHKSLEGFEIMRVRHAEFHMTASEIITLINDQKVDEASRLLNGKYETISYQLKRDILKLSKAVS